MKLSKLVLIASLAFAGATAAQAAPDTAKIAAKLQAASLNSTEKLKLPPSPTPEERHELKELFHSLSAAQKDELRDEFKDLTPKQQKALLRWWRDGQTSPS